MILSGMVKIFKQFGKRIKYYRNMRGLSQEELAEHSGLHRTYVGAVERGERNISLANIYKIANALDIKVEALFQTFDKDSLNDR